MSKVGQDIRGLLPAFDRVKLSCFEELDRQFHKVHQALDARKAGLEKAIAMEIDARVARLQGQLQETHKAQAYIKRVVGNSQEAISAYTDLDLLSAAADVESELESIARIEAQEEVSDTADFACMVNVDGVLDLISAMGEVQATAASPRSSQPTMGSLSTPSTAPRQYHATPTIQSESRPPMVFGLYDRAQERERPSSAGAVSRSRPRSSRPMSTPGFNSPQSTPQGKGSARDRGPQGHSSPLGRRPQSAGGGRTRLSWSGGSSRGESQRHHKAQR